jgi:hypothetical protein
MLRNLNIRQRLLAVYVVFAVLIMALGGFGLYAARANNESIQLYTFHVVESALHAGELRVGMLDLRRYEKDMVIHVADPAKVKEYQDKWTEAYGKAQKSFAEIERRMRDPAVAANLAEAKKSLQTYHDNIVAELPKLAGADVATANSAMRAGRDGFMKADGIISTAIELVGKRAAEVKAKFESGYQSVLYVTLALIAVAVVAMVWLGLTVSASIVVPLKRAEDFAAGVRDGDLTAEMQVQGADEAATLVTLAGRHAGKPAAHRRQCALGGRQHPGGQLRGGQRQPGPQPPHRADGGQPAADRLGDEPAHRHGEPDGRRGAHRQPTGEPGQQQCRARRSGGHRGGQHHGAHQPEQPAHRRHHWHHRRHCLPDQHPGAQRRGGGGARRRAGARICGGGRRGALAGAAQRRGGQGDQEPDRRQRRERR